LSDLGITNWKNISTSCNNYNDLPENNSTYLSILVNFLFGPSKKGFNDKYKWMIRQDRITQSCDKGITLQQLLPYVSDPPTNITDDACLKEALSLVLHFQGKIKIGTYNNDKSNQVFVFPELWSEVQNLSKMNCNMSYINDTTFKGFWYQPEKNPKVISKQKSDYLMEPRKVVTQLTSTEFYMCYLIVIGNYLLLLWINQQYHSTELRYYLPSGLLFSIWVLLMILRKYSIVFLTLPLIRALFFSVQNVFIQVRNKKRKNIMLELKKSKEKESVESQV